MNVARSFMKLGELSDASITGLINTGYDLLSSRYSFEQEIDPATGKAVSGVRGGVITVNIDGLPSLEITDWALNSKIYKSGVVVLCDADNNPVEKLFFEDGACTSMIIDFEQDGESYMLTQLTIHARQLKLNDFEFKQNWTINKY